MNIWRLIPIVLFAILFAWSIPFQAESAASVMPGWHTSVVTPTPNFKYASVIAVVLLLVLIAYMHLVSKNTTINMVVFFIHFICSLPVTLYLKNPIWYLSMEGTDVNVFGRQITFTTALLGIVFLLFFIGQIIFSVYYIRKNVSHHHFPFM